MFSLLCVMACGCSKKMKLISLILSVALRVPGSNEMDWCLDTIYALGSWLEGMWAGGLPGWSESGCWATWLGYGP